jgi:hypothetical protein
MIILVETSANSFTFIDDLLWTVMFSNDRENESGVKRNGKAATYGPRECLPKMPTVSSGSRSVDDTSSGRNGGRYP